MDFSDEPYVRKYTRKTLTSRLLGWEGRAVMDAMLGEFDAAGIFAIRGDAALCISAVTEIPIETVRVGLARLVETETWVVTAKAITWPTFEEAQNCMRSDRLRQRESRRARAARSVTDVTSGHDRSRRSVTDVTSSHVESPNVTLPPILPSSHPPSQESEPRAPAHVATPEPETDREPLPHERAEARAAAEPTGARPALRFEFRPEWKPKTSHRDLARSLGLTDEEVGERLHDCRNKTYPNGFRSEDKQFNRELAWAARDKETRTFKAQQLAARKANPHGLDENPGARRRPDDPRPQPVFDRIGAG